MSFHAEENDHTVDSVYVNQAKANASALSLFQEAWDELDRELEIPDFGEEDGDEWEFPPDSGLDPYGCRRGMYWSSRGEVRYVEKDDEWTYWVVVVRKRLYS